MVLAAPLVAVAAPLVAVPSGDYQPLKAMEVEHVSDGFEAAVLARLGQAMGREISVRAGAEGGVADLRIGIVSSGPVYYSSPLTALTAAGSGPQSWNEIRGKTVCLSEGSPHGDAIESRFGGVVRHYPSAAQALIGLKLGECQAVAGGLALLEPIAHLPEWRRYNRLLPVQHTYSVTLRVEAEDPVLKGQLQQILTDEAGRAIFAETVQYWVDEVAFQAYVLADTLDCH